MSNEWRYGLLGCFGDCGLCIKTCFCPCVVFGKIAEKVDESCILCGLSMLIHPIHVFTFYMIRDRVRTRKDIKGSPITDIISCLCCPCCAIVQTARELEEDDENNVIQQQPI